tara:strand:+ start:969 stop:1997 length:1029 start_codon:yes stop_codon:yes gene_type:complete
LSILESSSILITGGTGSFGKAFIKKVFSKYPNIKRLVIYSRDELKQWELSQIYPSNKYPNIRFFIGDIRDKERIQMALQDIDVVIHAAALKQVDVAEYNPMEFINTNVVGGDNLVKACLNSNVKKVINLSTDKACAPINLYGATKLCSDKLFTAANNISGNKNIRFSCVRYGNVMGSRGSVIPLFMHLAKADKTLKITDKDMTRFNITLEEGVRMVLYAIENCIGGEILVPKISSYKIMDLVEAIGPNCKKEITGIRPGEKIHEEMITVSDSLNTLDMEKYFSILPAGINNKYQEDFNKLKSKYNFVKQGFHYSSNNNIDFLSVEDIRNLIKDNIDSNFIPI